LRTRRDKSAVVIQLIPVDLLSSERTRQNSGR